MDKQVTLDETIETLAGELDVVDETQADELRIEYLPIDVLVPYARNARTHSEEQVQQLMVSITEFGWTNPILIDAQGGIRAGHGRVLAAQKLGMQRLPCIRLAHLTEEQLRAYVLADNKLALNAGWDEDLLKAELAALDEMSFDMSVIGFSDKELAALMDLTAGEEPDDGRADVLPKLSERPISRPGDVWCLGGHRLICGDCTDATVVACLLNGARPMLMVTDPPYGVDYEAAWREETFAGDRATGEVLNDDRADWREAWQLFPGEVAYVWHAANNGGLVQASLEACAFEIRSHIVWAKEHFAISRGHYHWQHEVCWYAVKKGAQANWTGDRAQSTLWQITREVNTTGHSTQKPVECMLRPILNHSVRGDLVYEPFSGSGTTIIAAEQSGRRCYACELNPLYVDLAVRRWQEFSGERAVREADGAAFDALTPVED